MPPTKKKQKVAATAATHPKPSITPQQAVFCDHVKLQMTDIVKTEDKRLRRRILEEAEDHSDVAMIALDSVTSVADRAREQAKEMWETFYQILDEERLQPKPQKLYQPPKPRPRPNAMSPAQTEAVRATACAQLDHLVCMARGQLGKSLWGFHDEATANALVADAMRTLARNVYTEADKWARGHYNPI
jgi:hypothetical protein